MECCKQTLYSDNVALKEFQALEFKTNNNMAITLHKKKNTLVACNFCKQLYSRLRTKISVSCF